MRSNKTLAFDSSNMPADTGSFKEVRTEEFGAWEEVVELDRSDRRQVAGFSCEGLRMVLKKE
jgi:hypothetical protein